MKSLATSCRINYDPNQPSDFQLDASWTLSVSVCNITVAITIIVLSYMTYVAVLGDPPNANTGVALLNSSDAAVASQG